MKIFIDIETIAAQSDSAIELLRSNIEQAKAKLSPPGNYGTEAAEKWLVKKRLELNNGYEQAHLKTSFDGGLGEVITISMIINGNSYTMYRSGDYSEADLLREFIAKVEDEASRKGGSLDKIQWIGHNVIKFDLLFLYKRCVINNLKPKFDIPVNARHGFNAYDTMQGWSGYGGTVSQDNLCKTLGLSTKQGMDGSMVYQAWLDGKHDEIAEYCKSDVDTVVSLYNRLTFN